MVHDLLCRDAAEMYFDLLKKQVSQFKNSEEGRRVMCKAVEELVERGKVDAMLAMAKRLLANGKLMLREIAECTGLSLVQVKKLQAETAST